MKRIFATKTVSLLLSVLLFWTTGCARQGENLAAHSGQEILAPSLEDNSAGTVGEGESSAKVLTKNTLSLSNRDDRIIFSAIAGQSIFLCGKCTDGSYNFYRFDIMENSITTLNVTYDKPIIAFSASEDGILYLLRVNEDGQHLITCLSPGSKEVNIEIANEVTIDTSIYSFAALDGGFLIDNYGEVLALDLSGAQVKSFGQYSHGAQIVRLSKNKAFIIYTGSLNANESGLKEIPTRVHYIDGNFNEISNVELTGGYNTFFAGVDETLFTSLAGTIYEYQYSSGALQEQFNYAQNNTDIPDYYIGNASFFTVESGKPIILKLSVNNSVKTLTLYSYNTDYMLTMAVQRFNETNCGYYIAIKDYAQFDELGTTDAGLGRYAAEVIAGNTPDIYDLGAFSAGQYSVKGTMADQYAAKGLLEDLSAYFKEDNNYSLSDLFNPVIEQSTFREGLYELVPAFSVLTLCSSDSYVSEKFTISDFRSLADLNIPEHLLGSDMTRANFLKYMLMFMGNELYDRDTVSCNFTSDTFLYLLDYAAQLPESAKQNDGTAIARAFAGEQLLLVQSLETSFIDTMAHCNAAFSGEACFTGFPNTSGSSPALIPQMELGMAVDSEYKDGVWEFFRFLLSQDIQMDFFSRQYLPSGKIALEKCIDHWLTSYFNEPTTLVIMGKDSETVRIPGDLKRDSAKSDAYAILNSIDTSVAYDEAIYEIIMDSCGPLFAGDKTSSQVASIIQSRVSIYLSEQYG